MKKLFSYLSICLLFSLFCATVGAQEIYDKVRLIEVIPESDGLSEDLRFLPVAVQEKIEANLSKYTEFRTVNGNDKNKIVDMHKESMNGQYDDNQIYDVGKFSTASHGLFLRVRKVGVNFTITLTFTDLTTSENILKIVSKPKTSVEDLYMNNGCAVDELTIDFCDALGIVLSGQKKSYLLNGDIDLSNYDQVKMANEVVKNYQSRIDKINKEMDIVRNDSNAEAILRQNQLKIEKSKNEERLKKAQQDKLRAEEEARQRLEDEEKQAMRSEEQKERISKVSENLAYKVQEARKLNISKAPVISQLKIIESLKKDFVMINNDIEIEKQKIFNKADADIENKRQEIYNRPLQSAEKGKDGHITNIARKNRNAELDEFSRKIIKNSNNDFNEYEKNMTACSKDLLKDIERSYSNLGIIVLNTLGKELVVDFSMYDGERYGWDLTVSLESEDVLLFQTTTFLSYESISGKKPAPFYNDAGYEDYMQSVDFYEGMFLCGEPYLTFELDCKITPCDKSHPSMYMFDFSNLRFYNTENLYIHDGKIISAKLGELQLSEKSEIRQMYPAYDLKTREEHEAEAAKREAQLKHEAELKLAREKEMEEAQRRLEEKQYKEYLAEQKKAEKEAEKARKKAEKEANKLLNADKWSNRTLIGVNYGLIDGAHLGQNAEIDLSIGWLEMFYFSYRLGLQMLNVDYTNRYPLTQDNSTVIANKFEIGTSGKIFNNFYLTLAVGLGCNIFTPQQSNDSKYPGYGQDTIYPDDLYYNSNYGSNSSVSASPVFNDDTIIDFTFGGSIGCDYVLWGHFNLNSTFSAYWIPIDDSKKSSKSKDDNNIDMTFTVGVGFRL